MAEYTYEEDTKKRPDPFKTQEYAYSSPVGTYYGEAGNPQSDAYGVIRQRLSDAADPARHAEQDAKIQRSRNFWTGANLFANVMANAINVNGTANNAPNMTWNDAASQKMYDTWRDADRELRAERRAAAQRLDALDLDDAKMRAAGAKERAAEGRNVYDINYRNSVADARVAYDRDEADWQREQKKQDELDKEARDLKNYEEKRKLDLRYTRRSGGGGGSSKAPKSYDFPVGRGDGRVVRAGSTFEQQLAMAQIADELKRVMNAGKEPGDEGWASYEDGKEYNFIARNFDRIYDSDPDFRDWFDSNFGEQAAVVGEEETVQQPESVGVAATPEYDQFGGYSVQPDTYSSPMPRKYAGTREGTERAYGSAAQRPVNRTKSSRTESKPKDNSPGDELPGTYGEKRYLRNSAGNMFEVDRHGDVYMYTPTGWKFLSPNGATTAEKIKKEGIGIEGGIYEINQIADRIDRRGGQSKPKSSNKSTKKEKSNGGSSASIFG